MNGERKRVGVRPAKVRLGSNDLRARIVGGDLDRPERVGFASVASEANQELPACSDIRAGKVYQGANSYTSHSGPLRGAAKGGFTQVKNRPRHRGGTKQ